jgi:penicillin-binding protein 1C
MKIKRFKTKFLIYFGLGILSNVTESLTPQVLGFETFERVRERSRPSEGVLYDRNHEVLHEIRVDSRIRQLEWADLDRVSPVLQEAVLLSEDHRFRDHGGVDWTALLSATAQGVLGRSFRGASTVSMQLASILDQQLVPLNQRRSWLQKSKQIQAAIQLEKEWTKDQILEAYLNLVSFRGELRGITAASYGLFSKAPHGLTREESLILSVLVRAPGAPLQKVKDRSCLLGKKMDAHFQCSTLDPILEPGVLQPQRIQPQISLAPHLAREVLLSGQTPQNSRKFLSRATVTVDKQVQEFVLDILKQQIFAVHDKNVHDAAALVVDNVSGEVLAYVGGIGSLSTASYVDGVRARRQAGSTLKPFLYALALERRYLTAASILDDSPIDIPVFGGVYRPRNYDHEFRGKTVSLRDALGSSLNVPAVRTLSLLGIEPFLGKLDALGFSSLKQSEYYGPSLALGSVDITLWDLVNAYRTLARGGVWSPLRWKPVESHSPEKRPVFSKESVFLVSDILSDRESRNLTFGLENSLSLPFWAAVKTGTSKDMRDNWCVGYSDRYTVGVWVGNFTGAPMWNVSGITGAAPAWSGIMKRLHRHHFSRPPIVPAGLRRIDTPKGKEWFISGTEPLETDAKSMFIANASVSGSLARITYPVNGLVVARDPDIPVEAQKLFFESNVSDPQLKWVLNGEVLGSNANRVSWQPLHAGKYKLSLVSQDGHVLDSSQFSVR